MSHHRILEVTLIMLLFVYQQVVGGLLPLEHGAAGGETGTVSHHTGMLMADAGHASERASGGEQHEISFCEVQCLCPANGCQSLAGGPGTVLGRLSLSAGWHGRSAFPPAVPGATPYRPPILA